MQTLLSSFIHHFAVQRSYIIHTSFPYFQKLTCVKPSFTIRAESNRLLPRHAVPSHAQIHLGIPHSHFQFYPCLPHPCGITPSTSQPETGNQYPRLGIPSLIDFAFREEFMKSHSGAPAWPLLSPDNKTTFTATRDKRLWMSSTGIQNNCK